ncbi:VIT domain-containing protein [Saltatorellus ferox]
MSQISTAACSRGAALVSTEGQSLPLGETRIETEAQGGIARVKLVQSFVNTGSEPLRVSYLLPLPEKAAVSGFSFELDGQVTRGVVQTREDARANFEEALLEGRSAAILEEESSTLFRQEVGNVPAGAEIVVTVELDQKLIWQAAAGAWEWRFPTVVAPRYQRPEIPDAEVERVKVQVADLPAGEHLGTRARLDLRIRDERSGEVASPSHRFRVSDLSGAAGTGVSFLDAEGEGGAGVPLDRDIVLRWPVAAAAPGVSLSVESAKVGEASGLYGLLTLVPPAQPKRTIPRDLIVLLDTSGSMSGEPLAQAVAVVSALIDSLGEDDRLELLEFSSSVSRWKRGARQATPRKRASAKRWLQSLQASGSTDMHGAILESLSLLGPESQRQVLVVTDGLIGGEKQLVHDVVKRLPAACRVHTLGIGHGVNRTLTAGAALAGRGVEQIVAPGEDPSSATRELLASMNQPILVDLKISGGAVRETAIGPMDVYAGTPSLIPVRLETDAKGRPKGKIVIEGRTADGVWKRTLDVSAAAAGSGANAALFARERVQQLETFDFRARSSTATDAEIERLGLDYQIATRRTSWVAISEARTVDPNEPTRSVEMPHELGAGLSAEGLGLRASLRFVRDVEGAGGMQYGAMPASAPVPLSRRDRPKKSKRPLMDEKSKMEFDDDLRNARLSIPASPADEDRDELASALEPMKELLLELIARVLLHKDGRLVVSFQAPDDMVWVDVGPITVEFEDGSVHAVNLELAGSTSGPVASGAEIRMVLTGLPEAPNASAIRVYVAGKTSIQLNLQK